MSSSGSHRSGSPNRRSSSPGRTQKNPDHILTYGVYYQFDDDEMEALYKLGYPTNEFPYFYQINEHAFIISEPNTAFIVAVCIDVNEIKILKAKAESDYISLDLTPSNVQQNKALASYLINELDLCSEKKTAQFSRLWKELDWANKKNKPAYIMFQKYEIYEQMERPSRRGCSIL